MLTYYAKKALKILQEGGVEIFIQRVITFIKYKLIVFPQRKLRDTRFISANQRFKFHNERNKLVNNFLFDAVPDPDKTIFINPSNIEYYNERIILPWYYGLAQISGGVWDQDYYSSPVIQNIVIKGIIEHFQLEKDWEDTVYYRYADNRYNTKADVYEDIQYYDKLFKKISNEGYVDANERATQIERKGEHTSHPAHSKLEILVTIGRDGKIYLRDGKHRFAIARVLGLERIPAHVLCRHKKWQEIRDEIYNNGLPKGHEELRDHPDLQDLLKVTSMRK